ncbi:MAG: NAD(P)/FAD-dependent oxidoreductase [Pseudomonadales bacterium]|nr:NAD(P)/FAD-dependent oxidoreductase [Pseudomonadales bacterium]
MSDNKFDVVIVGAGISGIGAAWHLQQYCPDRTYTILEGRENLGGTWDLFRYPGIRSDSDMYTLGYSFKPWTNARAIADGPSILSYLQETAEENGIDQHIQYCLHVESAAWSTETSTWQVEAVHTQTREVVRFECNFLYMCSGYYDYAEGYTPEFPGRQRFQGEVVHPQKWTSEINYTDKKVVIIGSGATAVTLVPEMAKEAAHVTMLQRSPTFVVARPGEDGVANWLRKYLSAKVAYGLTRWKNVLLGMFFFNMCRKNPERVRKMLLDGVREQLGEDFDINRHFNPAYNPWDQRMCLVPEGDMFTAIREGRASVVTDTIDTFTETGIQLKSGEHLDADMIVTATGLKLQMLSGMKITVDNRRIDLAETLTYKGMMFSDIPNLALSMGYTNASWTLKSDLTAGYVCRLLNHMKSKGLSWCCPKNTDTDLEFEPFMDLTSGYVQRAMASFPKQGSKRPWKLYQNYALDLATLGYGKVEDGVMTFGRCSSDKTVESPLDQAA